MTNGLYIDENGLLCKTIQNKKLIIEGFYTTPREILLLTKPIRNNRNTIKNRKLWKIQ